MSHIAYIGIGTNIEPRQERMDQAIVALERYGSVLRTSKIYETAPYGFTDQPDFLNAAVMLETELGAEALHEGLHSLEKELGRSERPRWHEREIDFDILFFDELVLETKNLTIPHSEVQRRIFVLRPLHDIAPGLVHPVFEKDIATLLIEVTHD